MSQPTPYTPTTDFSQQEANNASGRSTVNTAALDAEFANIDTTLDQTLANLQLIQRDDGKLADLVTQLHTLSPEVLNLMGGFRLTGLWAASTDYAIDDIATYEIYTYVCQSAHTSGLTFDGQYWEQFGFSGGGDAAQAAAEAQVSANDAASSALSASNSASTASGHATTATTQAGLASASAIAADASADAAAISETNAANSASSAASSAASISIPSGKAMVLKDSSGVAYLEGAYGTTAQRPGSPVAGYERFNSDTGKDEVWNGSAWVSALYDSDTGTTSNKIVKLNGSAQLPAVDGSLLTGVVPTIADNSITPAKLTQKLTLGTAQATTSVTSIDFTGIPNWANRITVMFNGVSTNGASLKRVQLGAGSVDSAGYFSLASTINSGGGAGLTNSTSGFDLPDSVAGNTLSGSIAFTHIGSNIWAVSGVIGSFTDTAYLSTIAGSKALSGVLDRIRLTTANGTDTFDAGSVNIMYE